MELICKRFWGEPKLKKPKELNNKTLIGKCKYNKHCTFNFYKVDENYFILWRDFFSRSMANCDALKAGIIHKYDKRFVYDDGGFGVVILRNEAIIKIQKNDWWSGWANDTVSNLCINFAKMVNDNKLFETPVKDTEYLTYEYEHVFEEFIKVAGINMFDTEVYNAFYGLKPLCKE